MRSAEMLAFLEKTEHSLADELETLAGVYVLTSRQIFEWYPVDDYYDASTEALGSVPYTPALFYRSGGSSRAASQRAQAATLQSDRSGLRQYSLVRRMW